MPTWLLGPALPMSKAGGQPPAGGVSDAPEGTSTLTPAGLAVEYVSAVPLDRASVADLIARHLRDEILQGILRAGSPLREAALAKGFDVSRNTVREAFRLLERDRLTSHQVHRGVVVRTLAPHEVSDLYRVRLLLERNGLRYSSPDKLDALRSAVAMGERHAQARDDRQVVNADLAFHQAIVDLAGSARLSEIFAGLLVELRLGLTLLEPDASKHWLDENRLLLSHLESGRLEVAEQAMDEYLRRSEQDLLDRL
jgi:DNA-binding GntR family transcriptional regulator